MAKEKLCRMCQHERRFHANKEKHVLGTSHCTKPNCKCRDFIDPEY